MRPLRQRCGLTLVEVLVVIAIIAVLIGLLLPAVQRVRDAAMRTRCLNQLHQIGLALQQYHEAHGSLPSGVSYQDGAARYPFMSWNTRLLPFLEMPSLWADAVQAFAQDKSFYPNPPHTDRAVVLSIFSCPADPRTSSPELPPGKFQTDARIFVVSPAGEKALGFTLPLAGTMQPEVRLLPSRLLLEAKPVGATAEAIVTLQVAADAKVAVDHIEIDSPDVQVEPVAIEGIPAGRAFRVRQKVTKAGEQVSEVRFFIRKADKKQEKLPVQVCCRGKAVSAVNAARGEQP